jgi:hypothetical protein
MAFGEMTVDLLETLKWTAESKERMSGWWCLESITHVSNLEIAVEMFELLPSVLSCIQTDRFFSIMKLLSRLAQLRIVSSRDVHQHISLIIKEASFENATEEYDLKKYLFDCLLDRGCIKNEVKKELLMQQKKKVFTEENIDQRYAEQIRWHDMNFKLVRSIKFSHLNTDFLVFVVPLCRRSFCYRIEVFSSSFFCCTACNNLFLRL